LYDYIANCAESQSEIRVGRMCELVQVSRACFYRHWLNRQPDAAEMKLRDAVQRVSLAHRFYGYRRVARELESEGIVVSEKIVRRVMQQDQLLAIRGRRFVVTTDSQHTFTVYPNLAEHMKLEMVNQLWVADFTYIRLGSEFVFLAVVLDAWSRRVIGWKLGRRLDTELGLGALRQAIEARRPETGLVHHSDGGSQYASRDYVRELEAIGATLSMSRPGRPWENGRCESFMGTLKKEEIDARAYSSLEHLERNIEEFIEKFYNPVRLHSALQYRSPLAFEQAHTAVQPWRPAALEFVVREEVSPASNAG
jgi:transposase InsO family protein